MISLRSRTYRTILYGIVAGFLLTAPALPGLSAEVQQPTNGLYFLTQPDDYNAFEDLVKSYRDSGANTVIIKPVTQSGNIDRQAIAKAVFFAHSAGMKLFVVLPTRGMHILLEDHPDWEDMHYDLQSGTVQPTGKLDIFNPRVIVYLSDLFMDIAGYSVDGIVLDDDFYYSDTEGMSALAMERYKQKYGSFFSPRNALGQVRENYFEGHRLDEYGEHFWNLAELKKNSLLLLLKNIMQSSRAVNKQVKFGISLHVPGLFLQNQNKELLAWYSHDMTAFKKMDIDFFWLAIPHRDLRSQQDMNYKKSIQAVSRISVTTGTLVKEPAKLVIAIQATSTSGTSLPLSEIEEVSSQVKKAGDPGIVFMVQPDTQLPSMLTKKIFKRQPE